MAGIRAGPPVVPRRTDPGGAQKGEANSAEAKERGRRLSLALPGGFTRLRRGWMPEAPNSARIRHFRWGSGLLVEKEPPLAAMGMIRGHVSKCGCGHPKGSRQLGRPAIPDPRFKPSHDSRKGGADVPGGHWGGFLPKGASRHVGGSRGRTGGGPRALGQTPGNQAARASSGARVEGRPSLFDNLYKLPQDWFRCGSPSRMVRWDAEQGKKVDADGDDVGFAPGAVARRVASPSAMMAGRHQARAASGSTICVAEGCLRMTRSTLGRNPTGRSVSSCLLGGASWGLGGFD